ncbi:MAG TPA: hypothetical protein VLZ11_06410 [Flavobacterium sp.]|nr:hypothetical protein [Flavobacterium sp.]
MKKIIIGVFCLATFLGFSQNRGGAEIGTGITGQVFNYGHKAVERHDIVGSPYYEATMNLASISTFEEGNISLRYNAFQDEMEFRNRGEVYYIPKSEDLTIKFLSPAKEYHYVGYTDKNKAYRGYLVVLSDTKVGLYKREQMKFSQAREPQNSYDEFRPAEYSKTADIYLIKVGAMIDNFPKNKKELIRTFPDKKAEISAYLKKTKISFSKEADLINLVHFLSTL